MTLFVLFGLTSILCAQDLSKDEMKAIKKEAKKLEKEGWKVKPGELPIIDQLVRSRRVQLEEDENGEKWIIGAASSIGGIYDAARMQALTLAKTEIAGLIKTNLTFKFKEILENRQQSGEGAESMANTAMNAQGVSIDQELRNPRMLLVVYRTLENKNIEVAIRIAIPKKKVNDITDNISGSFFKTANVIE
jgi:hypothetical protein